jgi:hypothetical protein
VHKYHCWPNNNLEISKKNPSPWRDIEVSLSLLFAILSHTNLLYKPHFNVRLTRPPTPRYSNWSFQVFRLNFHICLTHRLCVFHCTSTPPTIWSPYTIWCFVKTQYALCKLYNLKIKPSKWWMILKITIKKTLRTLT